MPFFIFRNQSQVFTTKGQKYDRCMTTNKKNRPLALKCAKLEKSRVVSVSKSVYIKVSASASTIRSFQSWSWSWNWNWLLRVSVSISKAETDFKKSQSRELILLYKDISIKDDRVLIWLLNISCLCLLLVLVLVSILAFKLLFSLDLKAWDCV